MSVAAETLRGMDPEIAAARKIIEKDETKTSVSDAMKLWMERSERENGKGSSTLAQYATLTKKIKAWAEANGLYYVDEITPLHLGTWYGSLEWGQLADTTRAQRWGCLRSIFQFLVNQGVLVRSPAASINRVRVARGHVQGPYTPKQVEKILASAANLVIPDNIELHRKKTYAPRINVFLRLLLGTGCDVSDATLHTADRIERRKVGRKTVYVYRYSRQKTGVRAVIPIASDLAELLLAVPNEAGCDPEMPFRTVGLKLKKDQKKWSARIMIVIAAAGIETIRVPSPDEDGSWSEKDANVKMLRHTFAVEQLKAGQRVEDVARMLGHVDTEMVRRHYAPWVTDLDDAHITRVVEAWGQR